MFYVHTLWNVLDSTELLIYVYINATMTGIYNYKVSCSLHTEYAQLAISSTQNNKDEKLNINKYNQCFTHILILRLACALLHEHTQVTEKWLSLWLVPAAKGKPTIANYQSLYTTEALAAWMPLHVFVCSCVYVCVIAREIGKLLVIYFSILKEDRRNVEEEGGDGRVWGSQAEKCRVNIKESEREVDDYIWQLLKMGSQAATDLHWDACWWQMSGDQDMPDAAGLKHRWPQIEALSQCLTSVPSCRSNVWPSCHLCVDTSFWISAPRIHRASVRFWLCGE